MHSEEYRRLYIACVEMAKHSNVPDVRARWWAMATDCFNRATEPAKRAGKRAGALPIRRL
jgi:hypothetical protein